LFLRFWTKACYTVLHDQEVAVSSAVQQHDGRLARVVLKWLLRYIGFVSATAIIAAIMPLGWMDVIHQRLGMGHLPDGPVVGYLARSTSGAYAIFGIFLWLFASDLRKYRVAIFFAAGAMLAAGVALGTFHLYSGMPTCWRIMEPTMCLLIGTIVMALNLRCGSQRSSEGGKL